MNQLTRRTATGLFAVAPLAACAGMEPRPAAFARIEGFIAQLAAVEMAPPGFTVSIVTGNDEMIGAWGVRNAETGTAMQTDTPIYIASMTKAFVGLMAVALEREGVLSLDRTVADCFPAARLPAPLNPAAITFRQLLSHQGHMSNEYLQHRTANTDEVPLSDYDRLLSIGTEFRADDFRYTNLGYLLYAAALQRQTGHSWRDHMRDQVTGPLRLRGASARASDYDADTIARGHERTREGWVTIPAKTNETMHAAGGMFATAQDMAKWLRAQMAPRGLPRTDFAKAHERLVSFAPDAYFDTAADGYAYGWLLADYRGLRLLHHGGTYTGFRSQMSLAPELGAGVAVLVPTDHLGGQFAAMVTEAIYDYLRDDAEADVRAQTRIQTFDADTRRHLDELIARREEIWSYVPREWSPSREAFEAYVGRYEHEGYGWMVVENGGDHLFAHMGVQTLHLTPGITDNFAGYDADLPHAVPERFEFRRAEDGTLSGVQWAEWGFFQRR